MKRIPVFITDPCPTCGLTNGWAIQNAATGCVVCRSCGQWCVTDPRAVLALQAIESLAALRILELVVAGVAIEVERRETAARAA